MADSKRTFAANRARAMILQERYNAVTRNKQSLFEPFGSSREVVDFLEHCGVLYDEPGRDRSHKHAVELAKANEERFIAWRTRRKILGTSTTPSQTERKPGSS